MVAVYEKNITMKPLKTAIPWGMKKFPSYRGGHLIGGCLERFYCISCYFFNEVENFLQLQAIFIIILDISIRYFYVQTFVQLQKVSKSQAATLGNITLLTFQTWAINITYFIFICHYSICFFIPLGYLFLQMQLKHLI